MLISLKLPKRINKQKTKEMITTTSRTASVPLYPDIQRVETFKLLGIVHCVPKKRPPFYFSNNFLKNLPILIIFGVLNPDSNVRTPPTYYGRNDKRKSVDVGVFRTGVGHFERQN